MNKTYLIAIGICLVIGGFIGWSLHPDDKSQEVIAKYEKRIKASKDSLNQIIKVKQKEIDSLKSLEPKIIIRYKEKQQNIDSVIAVDSLNSIIEYRSGLKLLGVGPDEDKNLTYREIGFGAKFFNKLQESIDLLLLKDNINQKQALIIQQLNDKADLLISENELLKLKECDGPSFWYRRFIVYIGLGMGYNGEKIEPNAQIGVGINILN